jgi:hypothetical protein
LALDIAERRKWHVVGAHGDALAGQHVEHAFARRRALFRVNVEDAVPVGPRERSDVVVRAIAEEEHLMAIAFHPE